MPDAPTPPRSGTPVRGSRSGRPIMALLDLLGRRWALGILWHLRDGESASSRQLRQRCGGVSAGVMQTRLDELRAAGLVEVADGYRLTAMGSTLLQTLAPLSEWAEQWADQQGGADARRFER